ncbi:MAG TPA: hypothetical protein VHS03_07020 [Gaiellaceae bacterium]|jgi:hypothetical protein|nr:hypothetical protein [Gaiellaceae bacterium]
MREIDELYADSGEPVKESHGVSRGTALKVGGVGLAGALAAFMPGRAGAAVRKKASNASCGGQGFVCIAGNYAKFCGYDNYSISACYCASIYYGRIRPKGAPIGACVENGYCYLLAPCRQQKDCGAGFVCTDGGCCGQPLCQHYCEQGSIGQAPSVKTHHTAAHK